MRVPAHAYRTAYLDLYRNLCIKGELTLVKLTAREAPVRGARTRKWIFYKVFRTWEVFTGRSFLSCQAAVHGSRRELPAQETRRSFHFGIYRLATVCVVPAQMVPGVLLFSCFPIPLNNHLSRFKL